MPFLRTTRLPEWSRPTPCRPAAAAAAAALPPSPAACLPSASAGSTELLDHHVDDVAILHVHLGRRGGRVGAEGE